MKTIAIINQKGGVAKTTTSINLAYYYAQKGLKVLAVDLDPQSNMTEAFKVESETSVYDSFVGKPVVKQRINDNLDVLPSSIRLSKIDLEIVNAFNREHIFAKVLEPLQSQYDICIIDCPPSLNFVTVNALVAADYAIIPLKPSTFSYDGLDMMLSFVQQIRTQLKPSLQILGIVLTFFDERKVVSKSTIAKLTEDQYIDFVFHSKIRQSEGLVRAEDARQSIFEYDATSSVAEDYRKLAEEILTKMQ